MMNKCKSAEKNERGNNRGFAQAEPDPSIATFSCREQQEIRLSELEPGRSNLANNPFGAVQPTQRRLGCDAGDWSFRDNGYVRPLRSAVSWMRRRRNHFEAAVIGSPEHRRST